MDGEQTIREDERQACWEDFMNVLTNAINNRTGLKALQARLREIGWEGLGTGDGKPMHRYLNSEVNKWMLRSQRSEKAKNRKGRVEK